MNNVHFVGEWFDCRIPIAVLGDPERIRALCNRHATHRNMSVDYEHFTLTAEAGVIGAMTSHEMHLVIRTFPRHHSLIVDLFVGDKQLTDPFPRDRVSTVDSYAHRGPASELTAAMDIFDGLRDEFRPMRALLHRVPPHGEALTGHGRTPRAPTEVLMFKPPRRVTDRERPPGIRHTQVF